MVLVGMLHADEDSFICDMAETYGVFDWRALPLRLAATLAAGLPGSSRSMRKLAGTEYSTDTLLLASAVDNLAMLVWLNSSDGAKGHNRPQSILEALIGKGEKQTDYMVFNSAEEFRRAYDERMKNNGERH